ncbi:MAG: LptF/LptG family permease [Nitrospirota bacterium]
MKIIHRSIFKELVLAFILSLVFLNFVLMMEKLLRLSRFISGVGASITDMVRIIFYLQPQLLLLTIPMGLLLSTLLIYGRLLVDSELVILKSNGLNFKSISMPVIMLGILCFLFNLAVSFYIGPKSSRKLRDEIGNIIRIRTPLSIEEGKFNTSFKDLIVLVKEKLSDNTIKGIFIYDGRNRNEPRILMAKEAKIYVPDGLNINLCLKEGYIHIARGKNTTELFFQRYNIILRLESDSLSRKNAELTPPELLKEIAKRQKQSIIPFQLELQRRLSLPLLCLILIFFGPPLALKTGKSGKLGGLALGLVVVTLYYMLLVYGENLAKSGKIAHYIGAWTPTVVLATVGLWMFIRENSR